MKRRSLIKALYLLCVLFTLSSAQSVKLVKPGKNPKYGDCDYVHHIPSDEQCEYLKNVTSDMCGEANGFFFNYAELVYCSGYNLYGLLFAFTIVLINLFFVIGLTAGGFFCPALASIAIKLGMSENLAGHSLLALGNGAPDVLTTVSGLAGDPDVELVYSHLMGGGLFITLFAVGIVCIISPFKVEGKLYMRDGLFYIVALIWAYLVLRNPRVYFWEAVMFLVLYGIYVIVVLLTGSKRNIEDRGGSKLAIYQTMLDREKTIYDPKELMYLQMVIKTQCARKKTKKWETKVIIIQPGLFKEFLNRISPFEDWGKKGILGRIFCIWKAPYKLFLCLVIPIVDYDAPKHGWCKLLNIVNIFLLPVYINIVTGAGSYYPFRGVPMFLITFLFSISLAIFIGFTSDQMMPPGYYVEMFAPLAFIGSMITDYTAVSEMVAVLKALALVFRATPTTIGCTLHAWGNSVGDFVTILSLAKKGFPKMAFAGAYGGSIFNLLLSLGYAATMVTVTNGRNGDGYYFASNIGIHAANILLNMLSGLVSSLIMLPLMGFHARRSYGKYLIFVYGLFNLNLLLNEYHLIHPLEAVYLQQITYPNGTLVYKHVEVI